MAIALVSGQVASALNSGGSANTLNVVLPNNPTSGNFVAVEFVIQTASFTSMTVKDSNNNSYVATAKTPFTITKSGAGKLGIFYLMSAPANATKTITVAFVGTASSTNNFNVWAAEFSGVKTSAALENDATVNQSTGSTAITTPSITSTNDGDLFIGIVGAGSTITGTASPFTGIDVVRNGNYAGYYVQPTHGARANAFTQSPSGVWDAMLAAFIAAPPPAAGSVPWPLLRPLMVI